MTKSLTVHHYNPFSACVTTSTIDNPQLLGLCTEQLSRARMSDGIHASNRGAFHTDRRFDLGEPLRALVLEVCDAALHYWMKTRGVAHMAITECWGIVAGPHDYLVPHTHFPAPWAGVLYLDVDSCLAAAEGDEGDLVLHSPVPLAQVFHLEPTFNIKPKNGKIVLFPGALMHSMQPHKANALRYSVSFNLMGMGVRVDGK